MSQRGKRPNNRLDNDEPPPSKRRKGRPPAKVTAAISAAAAAAAAADDEDAAGASAWQPRPITDLKMNSIYNRSAPEAPAELFRKDLISAMKLPDSEPLALDEYWVINDQWKQEWERGVQVPVNPDSLPEPSVSAQLHESFYTGRQDFKLPKNKFIRITKDESFSSEQHYLSNTPAKADAACAYDLDQCDDAWLNLLNGERAMAGLTTVSDEQFERVVEELEVRCWDKIQAIMKSEEGLGIEYDENVICDVCRSPDSEEANEMVFCDSCNICVHQACYGITTIPSGSWLCRTCSMAKRPDCVLCPNKGGAMKSTRSGQKWAHVSCALWIPEVSIGSVDRMEPITKISSIPQSRWALICVLCRERVGACIQCSVKTCKTAYHVTCAFQHGLEMRAIIEDENAEDGVKLRSYCLKHSMNKNKKEKCASSTNNNAAGAGSGSEDEDNKRKKQRKDMTTEERNLARQKRLQEVEAEFDKHVNVRDISCHLLEVDQEAIHCIYNYWILKRKSTCNRALLPAKSEDVDMIAHKQEPADIEKMKMFVHLRQDLERVRNLCYMVSRREKLGRSFFKMREQTFHKQITVLSEVKHNELDETVLEAVLQANHGPSIYDKLYSSDKYGGGGGGSAVPVAGDELIGNIEQLISRLMGVKSPTPTAATSSNSNSKLLAVDRSAEGSAIKTDLNGLTKHAKKRLTSPDPFKRSYINGAATTKNSIYGGSSLSSDSDIGVDKHNLRSSSNDDSPRLAASAASVPSTPTSAAKKKLSASQRTAKSAVATAKSSALDTKAERRKRRTNSVAARVAKTAIESSSDDDTTTVPAVNPSKVTAKAQDMGNKLLCQMARELEKYKLSGTESDELIPIRNMSGQRIATGETKKMSSTIYSDSDSTDKDKTDNTASDSQQHPFRTKAAMKEFNMHAGKATSATETPATGNQQQQQRAVARAKSKEKEAAAVERLLGKEKEEKARRDADLVTVDVEKKKLEAAQAIESAMVEKVMRDKEQAKEKAEKEKVAREKAEEKERLAHKEKLQRDKAEEKERQLKIQKEKAEAERLQKQTAESDRLKAETAEREKEKQERVKEREKASKAGNYATDLLVVPQRKAAKKASENMMRTTVATTSKKDAKEQRDEERAAEKEKLKESIEKFADSSMQSTNTLKPTTTPLKESPAKSETVGAKRGRKSALELQKLKQKTATKEKETPVASSTEVTVDTLSSSSTASSSSKDKKLKEKEVMSAVTYVPQRQAAKKAAEHIKSGLGKPAADPSTANSTSTSTSSDEKSAKTPSVAVSKKDDKKAAVVTSCSSSDSSSNSSSYSSSSSSSDSEDEESAPIKNTSTTSTASANDKAKELPFLNKVPKSTGSVSSNESSSSDTDSSAGSSDASSSIEPTPPAKTTQRNNKRPVKAPIVAAKKQQPLRKEAEKKLKTSELERTEAAETVGHIGSTSTTTINTTTNTTSNASKRDEPIVTPSPAPRTVGRAGKRQSVSSDRRRSIDIRSGNLAKTTKAALEQQQQQSYDKAASARTETSIAVYPTPTAAAVTTSATKSTASDTTTRKRKSSLLIDTTEAIIAATEKSIKNTPQRRSSIASTKANKEGSKSSELSPKKRETNEKLIAEPVGSLEKEITERKASSNNRLNKSSGSLDKLLSRRERDVQKASVKENHAEEAMDVALVVVPAKEMVTVKEDTKETIEPVKPAAIEIIDITDNDEHVVDRPIEKRPMSPMRLDDVFKPEDEKPELILNKFEANVPVAAKSERIDSKSPIKLDISAERTTEPMYSPLRPTDHLNTHETCSASVFGLENGLSDTFDNDLSATTEDLFLLADAPIFTFPTENLFNKDFKEDSAKETMDLVGKLRQKINKKNDKPTRSEPQIIELDTSPEESLDTATEKSDVPSKDTGDEPTVEISTELMMLDQDNNHNKNKVDAISDQWQPAGPEINLSDSSKDLQHISQHSHDLHPIFTDEQHQSIAAKLMNHADNSMHADVTAAAQDLLKHMHSLDLISGAKKFLQNDALQQQQQMSQHQTANHMQPIIRHHVGDSADENDHSPHMRPVNKWTESEMIQTRRSVSTSPSSASDCNDDEMSGMQQQQQQQQYHMQQQHHHQQLQHLQTSLLHQQQQQQQQQQQNMHHHMQQQQQQQLHQNQHLQDSRSAHIRKMNDIAFTNMHPDQQAFAVPSQQDSSVEPINPFNFNDTGTYHHQGPVSLFPPTGHNVQLPFPSPGAAMFPPTFGSTFSNNTSSSTTATTTINSMQQQQQHHHMQQPLSHQQQQQQQPIMSSKHSDHHHSQQQQNQLTYPSNPCGAAFTSSSHNMALTEAIIAQPQPPQMPPTSSHHQQHDNSMTTAHNHHTMNHAHETSAAPAVSVTEPVNQQHLHHDSSPPVQASIVKASGIENDHQQQKTTTGKRSTRIVAQQAAHNIQQQLAKSPSKSPSKSPRQPADVLRHNQQQQQPFGVTITSGKGRNEPSTRGRKSYNTGGAKATRGQGRPRGGRGSRGGRGGAAANAIPTAMIQPHHSHHPHYPNQVPVVPEYVSFLSGTIHTKLAGTVYDLDFDEDFAGENVENLKAMRDRRRSVDSRHEQFRRDSSQSPKFASPNNHKSSRMPFNQSDIRDLRPPTPVRRDSVSGVAAAAVISISNATSHMTSPAASSIHSIVSPVLPGPVDMRTYNFDTTNSEAYNNSLLGAFASGTADQTLQDIDETEEKAFQSSLMASNTKPNATTTTTTTVTAVPPPMAEADDVFVAAAVAQVVPTTITTSVVPVVDSIIEEASIDYDLPMAPSLFKLKIKGPHAHPDNYTSTSVQLPIVGVIPQLLDHQTTTAYLQNSLINAVTQATPVTPNLRRMRKKELLRQYWTQDMNMDAGNAVLPPEHVPAVHTFISTTGRSVGIPKAVDSMSSIPTKDDYKDYATMDHKKRKTGLSRELRQLDIPFDTEAPERRRSVGSNASSNSATNAAAEVTKRMTRTKQQLATMATPKLRITIATNSADPTQITAESTLIGIRPPKKRLATMPVPSLEDLKRESMNYRKQVMGEFDKEKKVKSKKSKSSKAEKREEKREEKRKRKKEKKQLQQQQNNVKIISSANDTDTPKLIIRFGKRKAEDANDGVDPLTLNAPTTTVNNRASSNKSASTSPIITPIRLKIARNSHGSSYVAIGDKDSSSGEPNATTQPPLNHKRKHSDGGDNVGSGSGSGSTMSNILSLDPLHPRLNPSVVISDVSKMVGKFRMSEYSDIKQLTTIDKRTKQVDPDPPPPQNLGNAQPPADAAGGMADNSATTTTTTTTATAEEPSSKPSLTDAVVVAATAVTAKNDQDPPSHKGCPPLPLSKDCEVR